MKLLFDSILRLRMALAGPILWQPFVRSLRAPADVQRRVLHSILWRNRATRFGREHDFSGIRSPEEYAARVPIRTYEDLRPYIERQESQKSPELLADQPIMYARTSGTTGQPKHIPILADTIARYQRSQRIFSYCHYSAIPGIFSGKILAFVSPAVEGRLETGTPYGSMSGLIYQSVPWPMRRNYLIPPAVFECANHELKYLLIALLAVAERSITYIAGANPSTFLKLAEVIRRRAGDLIPAIEKGELPGRGELEPGVYQGMQAAFRPDPRRAEELRAMGATAEGATFARLWPELKAVSCWREGSCRVLLPALQRQLPPAVPILELGYLASECRGSLAVDSRRHLEVPTIHENFFEFIERDDWESGRPRIRTVTQLERGRAYYVIITTREGLYRYFMNDIVMVDGSFGSTPTIKFLEKGAGATNITGEKLYESQVSTVLERVFEGRQWSPVFFVLLADPGRQRYDLYLEHPGGDPAGVERELDGALAEMNLEYKSKRESGRLHPIELRILRPGAGEAYKAHLVAQGQREAQFKFVRLQVRAKLTFDLDEYLVSPP